jgi:hypothetical protein
MPMEPPQRLAEPIAESFGVAANLQRTRPCDEQLDPPEVLRTPSCLVFFANQPPQRLATG